MMRVKDLSARYSFLDSSRWNRRKWRYLKKRYPQFDSFFVAEDSGHEKVWGMRGTIPRPDNVIYRLTGAPGAAGTDEAS
jgi:hypothetical protein